MAIFCPVRIFSILLHIDRDLTGLERCPVSFENAIDFEKCFCHGKTCSKGQYCYSENDEFSCRSSPSPCEGFFSTCVWKLSMRLFSIVSGE